MLIEPADMLWPVIARANATFSARPAGYFVNAALPLRDFPRG